MKLEEQVVSLELAKRLKELGVKQDGFYVWRHQTAVNQQILMQRDVSDWENDRYRRTNRPEVQEQFDKENEFYSAFTVAELGEMLPKVLKLPKTELYLMSEYDPFDPLWVVQYVDDHYNLILKEHSVMADTEADARGKLLIYLIENKLVDPERNS